MNKLDVSYETSRWVCIVFVIVQSYASLPDLSYILMGTNSCYRELFVFSLSMIPLLPSTYCSLDTHIFSVHMWKKIITIGVFFSVIFILCGIMELKNEKLYFSKLSRHAWLDIMLSIL